MADEKSGCREQKRGRCRYLEFSERKGTRLFMTRIPHVLTVLRKVEGNVPASTLEDNFKTYCMFVRGFSLMPCQIGVPFKRT